MFLKPVNRLVNLFEQMQDGMTGLQRFNEIMEQEPETDSENAVSPKDIKGIYALKTLASNIRIQTRQKRKARLYRT